MLRFPPKSILVPFDFSDVSMVAWQHAKALADRFGASIEVIYVEELLPPSAWPYQVQPFNAKMKKEISDHLHDKIGAVDKVDITQGDPVVTIIRLAKSRRPDLIVMGTHGRTGFDHFWMGSVAEAVVRMSPVPVLTAHQAPQTVHSVLSPVNLTEYSELGLAYAAEVSACLKASLVALNVTDKLVNSTGARTKLETLVHDLPEEIRHECKPLIKIQQGDAPSKILEEAKKHQLVVLVAHRKSVLKDMAIGMTAERILRFSNVPVLSVPAPKGAFHLRRDFSQLVGAKR